MKKSLNYLRFSTVLILLAFSPNLWAEDFLDQVGQKVQQILPEAQYEQQEPSFSPHKLNYAIGSQGSLDEGRLREEAKFQLSVKQRVIAWHSLSLYLAYTQKSFWQITDLENSRPFRETNHNPELFVRLGGYSLGPGLFKTDLGYEHESNGQPEPLSRSWDRTYIRLAYGLKSTGMKLKIWHRIEEAPKEYPEDTKGDENPLILDYMGNGELTGWFSLGEFRFDLMARKNPSTGYGAARCDLTWPIPHSNVFLLFQWFSGYGESLIDHQLSQNRYGVGLAFSRPRI